MNAAARTLLVAAAYDGRPQAFGVMHDPSGADCPYGVLHRSLHGSREEALTCCALPVRSRQARACVTRVTATYRLLDPAAPCPLCGAPFTVSLERLLHLSDAHRLGFLGLAQAMAA